MDMVRFRSHAAQGIFEGDGDAYARWSAWADGIRDAIRAAEDRHAISSRGVPEAEVRAVVDLCASDPLSAIHVVAHDMLHHGTRWTHLRLLRTLAGLAEAPYFDVTHVQGRYVAQVVRSLAWYDDMCRGPEPVPSVLVEPRHRSHVVSCEDGDEILVLADGASLRLELKADGRGAAVTLDATAAGAFLARLDELVPEHYGRFGKGGLFLGDGREQGERTGLHLVATNRGEPFREVIRFTVEGSDWTTFASVEVAQHEVRGLVREARRLLDVTDAEPEAVVPGVR